MKTIRISASVRLILAVFHLRASITENFGQAIIDILSEQYPTMLAEMAEDAKYKENAAATIGNRMLMKAKREVQNQEQDAFDAVQDFLEYLVKSKFDFKKTGKRGRKGAATWRHALNNVMSNVRARAQSHSYKKFNKGKSTDEELYADLLHRKRESEAGSDRYKWKDEDEEQLQTLGDQLEAAGKDPSEIRPLKLRRKNFRDRTIDEAFGARGEDGGAPEGGEGKIPEESTSSVDDKAAVKSFLDALDELIPDLQSELGKKSFVQRMLFEFIMKDEGGEKTGTFLPGTKENMGQGSAFRDWLEEVANSDSSDALETRALLNSKKKSGWSRFMTKARADLLKSIIDFTEKYMTEDEYQELWDAMYGVMTPGRLKSLTDSLSVPSSGAPGERRRDLGQILDRKMTIKKLESTVGKLNKRKNTPGVSKADKDAIDVALKDLQQKLDEAFDWVRDRESRVWHDMKRDGLSYNEEMKKEVARRESEAEGRETSGASQRRKDLRKILRLRSERDAGVISPADDAALGKLEARVEKEMGKEEKEFEKELEKEAEKIKGTRSFADDMKRIVYLEERRKLLVPDEQDYQEVTKELTQLQQRLLRELRPQGISMRAELMKAHEEHFTDARDAAEEELKEYLRAHDIAEDAMRDVDDAMRVKRVLMGLPAEEESPARSKEPFPSREKREREDILEEGIAVEDRPSDPLRPTLEERLKAKADKPEPSAPEPSAPEPSAPSAEALPWSQPLPEPPRPKRAVPDEDLSFEEMKKLSLEERLKRQGLMSTVMNVARSLES